jgi:hypothetical protein
VALLEEIGTVLLAATPPLDESRRARMEARIAYALGALAARQRVQATRRQRWRKVIAGVIAAAATLLFAAGALALPLSPPPPGVRERPELPRA